MYCKVKKFNKALTYVNNVENSYCYLQMAQIQLNKKIINLNEIIKYLLTALKYDKKNGLAYYELGRIYSNGKLIKKDIKKAIYYFEKSIEVSKLYISYYELGKIYAYSSNFIDLDKAHCLFELSIKNLITPQVYFDIGYIFEKKGLKSLSKHYYNLSKTPLLP